MPVALRQLGTLYFDQGQLIQAYPLLSCRGTAAGRSGPATEARSG